MKLAVGFSILTKFRRRRRRRLFEHSGVEGAKCVISVATGRRCVGGGKTDVALEAGLLKCFSGELSDQRKLLFNQLFTIYRPVSNTFLVYSGVRSSPHDLARLLILMQC